MQAQAKSYIEPDDYLAIDSQAEYKSEYFRGEIFAMSGASLRHAEIVTNLVSNLHGQLRKSSCRVYSSDVRVKVAPTGLYTYPDVVIVCGKAQTERKKEDTLINPVVILEILSPSTEAYDRGEKFEHYRTLESLTDYLLVAQNKAKIEHFHRQDDGQWALSESRSIDDTIEIASIECKLALSEVYDKVEFDEEKPPKLRRVHERRRDEAYQ